MITVEKLHAINHPTYRDIRFNFLICQNFTIEGLGWNYQSDNRMNQTLLIGFLTNFLNSDGTFSSTLMAFLEDGKVIERLSNNVQPTIPEVNTPAPTSPTTEESTTTTKEETTTTEGQASTTIELTTTKKNPSTPPTVEPTTTNSSWQVQLEATEVASSVPVEPVGTWKL